MFLVKKEIDGMYIGFNSTKVNYHNDFLGENYPIRKLDNDCYLISDKNGYLFDYLVQNMNLKKKFTYRYVCDVIVPYIKEAAIKFYLKTEDGFIPQSFILTDSKKVYLISTDLVCEEIDNYCYIADKKVFRQFLDSSMDKNKNKIGFDFINSVYADFSKLNANNYRIGYFKIEGDNKDECNSSCKEE